MLKFFQKQDAIRVQKSKLGAHKLKLPELAAKILGAESREQEEDDEEEEAEEEELIGNADNGSNDQNSGSKKKNNKKNKKRKKKVNIATPKISLSNEFESRNLVIPEIVKSNAFADENNTPAGIFAGDENERVIQLEKEKNKDSASELTRKREKLFQEIRRVLKIANFISLAVMICLVCLGATFIEAKKIVKSYNGYLAFVFSFPFFKPSFYHLNLSKSYAKLHPKENLDIFKDFLTPENLVFFVVDGLFYLVLYVLASLNVFTYVLACAIAYICFDECLKRGLTRPEDINARVSFSFISLNFISSFFLTKI